MFPANPFIVSSILSQAQQDVGLSPADGNDDDSVEDVPLSDQVLARASGEYVRSLFTGRRPQSDGDVADPPQRPGFDFAEAAGHSNPSGQSGRSTQRHPHLGASTSQTSESLAQWETVNVGAPPLPGFGEHETPMAANLASRSDVAASAEAAARALTIALMGGAGGSGAVPGWGHFAVNTAPDMLQSVLASQQVVNAGTGGEGGQTLGGGLPNDGFGRGSNDGSVGSAGSVPPHSGPHSRGSTAGLPFAADGTPVPSSHTASTAWAASNGRQAVVGAPIVAGPTSDNCDHVEASATGFGGVMGSTTTRQHVRNPSERVLSVGGKVVTAQFTNESPLARLAELAPSLVAHGSIEARGAAPMLPVELGGATGPIPFSTGPPGSGASGTAGAVDAAGPGARADAGFGVDGLGRRFKVVRLSPSEVLRTFRAQLFAVGVAVGSGSYRRSARRAHKISFLGSALHAHNNRLRGTRAAKVMTLGLAAGAVRRRNHRRRSLLLGAVGLCVAAPRWRRFDRVRTRVFALALAAVAPRWRLSPPAFLKPKAKRTARKKPASRKRGGLKKPKNPPSGLKNIFWTQLDVPVEGTLWEGGVAAAGAAGEAGAGGAKDTTEQVAADAVAELFPDLMDMFAAKQTAAASAAKKKKPKSDSTVRLLDSKISQNMAISLSSKVLAAVCCLRVPSAGFNAASCGTVASLTRRRSSSNQRL